MSRFTTVQRHNIYKQALKIYKDKVHYTDSEHMPVIGMCYAIRGACVRLRVVYEDLSDFPEVEKLNPGVNHKISYFWPLLDVGIRVEMFNQIINQTKQK